MELAFLTSLILMLALGNPFISFLNKIRAGQNVSQFLPEHQAKQGTPTMGGLLMLVIVAATLALCVTLRLNTNLTIYDSITYFSDISQQVKSDKVWIIFIGMVGYALLGFFDDYLLPKIGRKKGFGWKAKILLQFILALPLIWFAYPYLADPFFFGADSKQLTIIGTILAALFIVWWVNSVNLTDGIDGLAAGNIALALSGLLLLANYKTQALELSTALIWSVVGVTVGFLWWNVPKAKMFMGDTGSMMLGAAFALYAIMSNEVFWLSYLVGGVFCIESLSVIIQLGSVKLTKKRIFKSSPLHHHFEQLGWKEAEISVRFWIITLLFIILSTFIKFNLIPRITRFTP